MELTFLARVSKTPIFFEARLPNAVLIGCDFSDTSFVEANLRNSMLAKSNLEYSDLSGATLSDAILKGTNLNFSLFGPDTKMSSTVFDGTCIAGVDLKDVSKFTIFLDVVFGDGSTILPKGIAWPDHWPKEKLEQEDFVAQWRAFAASKGVEIPY